MVLIIDNYDSFVFNVARYCEELGQQTTVVRNDKISLGDIEEMDPSFIVVSPGPGAPPEAGVSMAVIRALSGRIPILGVCLGHQCVGAAFGGDIVQAKAPMHGRPSLIEHSGRALFASIPTPLRVGRYHSLIVKPKPEMLHALAVDALSPEGEIMALSHRSHPTFGVQFHPESILTDFGHALLANFLRLKSEGSHGDMAEWRA